MTASGASEQENYAPARGYVPDTVTAIAIARAVLVPMMGRHAVKSEEPFSAYREGDTWTVTGNHHCQVGDSCLASVDAVVKLAVADGQIIFLTRPKRVLLLHRVGR